MTPSNNFDMLIIGAGISGLSMAHYLSKAGKKVLVLEADGRPGGSVSTAQFPKKNFWMEMGAHTCYNTYSNLIEMAVDCGLKKDMIAREKQSMKLFNGELKGLFSQINKWELLRSLPNMFFLKKKGQSVASFYSRVLGKNNYKRMFSRMFNAVIVQDSSEYAADLFLKRRNTRLKEFPRSFTFLDGMQQLLNAILRDDNITLITEAPVTEVSRIDGDFQVVTAQNELYRAKNITFAVSPKIAGDLLKALEPQLSQNLKMIPVQKICTRGIVVSRKQVSVDPHSFIIPLSGDCYSEVSRDVVPHDKYRGFAFHFKKDDSQKEEQLQFMDHILGLDPNGEKEIVEEIHHLPLLKVGHSSHIKQMELLLQQTGIYMTGNFFEGLSLEDCVSRSHTEFIRYQNNC